MDNIFIYIFILCIGLIGYKVNSLTISGAVTACLVGIFIFLGIGIKGLILLGVFFSLSSFWSKYKGKQKKKMEEILEKGGQRDYSQVLANGSLPALFSIIYWISPTDYWLLAFCISIAAANSDTWASEIGSLSKRPPVHIFSRKRVPAGTSGAISILGFFASLFGSLIIALGSFLLFSDFTLYSVLIVLVGGLLGSIIDTVIGATIQAKYKCSTCHIITERPIHCHGKTYLLFGVSWMDNNKTNFFSILLATSIGLLISSIVNF